MATKMMTAVLQCSSRRTCARARPFERTPEGIVRRLSKGPSGSRPESLQARLRARYPDISTTHMPSITLAFLALHELSAVIPLLGTFFILQASATGERIVRWIHQAIGDSPPPSHKGSSSASLSLWLRSFVSSAFEEASTKISRMAVRYGWVDADNGDQALSMMNSSVVASGLVAYLSVKILFPLRMGLSLYLAPSLARYFRSYYPLFQRRKITKAQVDKESQQNLP